MNKRTVDRRLRRACERICDQIDRDYMEEAQRQLEMFAYFASLPKPKRGEVLTWRIAPRAKA
jgi:hypothetical protein